MPSNESGVEKGRLLRASSWTIMRRVIGALLLRELLTRYGRNNIGFLWLFVEPMIFVLVITFIWTHIRTLTGSNIPIVAFALTGYSSMLMWRGMPSRCIGAYKANLSLLYHRQVTILDVNFARIALEFLAVTTSFVALGIAFYALEWLPPPEDTLQVLAGWMLLAWFGAALGLTIGALAERSRVVANLWPPMSFILMAFSGVAFLLDALPPTLRSYALWLPQVSSLEYMREGWFGSLFVAHYDLPYAILCNLFLTFAGLSLVRQIGSDVSEE